MSHVLLTSIGSFGDVFPYVGVGRALADRGHRVTLVVPPFYRKTVEDAGLECRPFGGDDGPPPQELVARIMNPVTGARFLVRDFLMPFVEPMYDQLLAAAQDADVIVSHPLTFAAPLVAERLRRPWVGSALAPLSVFSRKDPPLIAYGPRFAAIHRRVPALSTLVIPIGKRVTRSWVAPIAALRQRIGLPPGGHPLYEGQFSPFLNLAMFSRVLAEPQSDWPPKTVITGAVSYPSDERMPDALAAFLDRGEPPIVFTLGSSAVSAGGAPAFFDASASAAQALRRRAVLLVGAASKHQPVVDADRIFVADWAAHAPLFRRAAVVVHQGGSGTMHTAFAAARPMVIVPFAHDQPDNAARAERLGTARVIYPRQYTASRVAAVLTGLLDRPDIARRAAEIAATVNNERGAQTSAAAIERLAATRH